MGDTGDFYRAWEEHKRSLKRECRQCQAFTDVAHPSKLMPGQQCKVCGYRDPRQREHEMTTWITQSRNATSPALASAALVEVECEYPAWRYRVDEVCWEPGLRYRQLLDPDGIPYISAEGLKGWAEYVATDSDGVVVQYSVRPEEIKGIERGFWLPDDVPIGLAPASHAHPGDWRESLCRVWLEENNNGETE